jgi:hypothetical protein
MIITTSDFITFVVGWGIIYLAWWFIKTSLGLTFHPLSEEELKQKRRKIKDLDSLSYENGDHGSITTFD